MQASDLYHDCMCRELAQWSRRARELGTETRALRLELEASTLQVQQLDEQLQSQHSLAADHQAAEALLKQVPRVSAIFANPGARDTIGWDVKGGAGGLGCKCWC